MPLETGDDEQLVGRRFLSNLHYLSLFASFVRARMLLPRQTCIATFLES